MTYEGIGKKGGGRGEGGREREREKVNNNKTQPRALRSCMFKTQYFSPSPEAVSLGRLRLGQQGNECSDRTGRVEARAGMQGASVSRAALTLHDQQGQQ